MSERDRHSSSRYVSRERSTSRTARGLNRVPPTRTENTQRRQKSQKPRKTLKERQIKIRERAFSLGVGLDMQLLLLVLLLLGIGLSTLFSASYVYAFNYNGTSYNFISKQGIFAIAGVVAMLAISTFNYTYIGRLKWPLFVFSFGMLLVVCFGKGTSIVPTINGANRWIQLGGFSIQPSELAKFVSVLMIATTLSKYEGQDVPFWQGVVPCFFWFGIFAIFVVVEPHVSATLIIAFICFSVMLVGGVKLRYFICIALPVMIVGGFYIAKSGKFAHVSNRIQGWINPFNPPEGVDTYQTRQSLYAIGSGGIFGTGIGKSKLKHLFLPEPQNDFVFAIFCEEMGLAGAIVVIILFLWLCWRGITISINAKDRLGTLLGIGITFQVGIQAALNICVVTNAIPNTGISLPFFSYGGSSLFVLLCEMGVLLSISRYNFKQNPTKILREAEHSIEKPRKKLFSKNIER